MNQRLMLTAILLFISPAFAGSLSSMYASGNSSGPLKVYDKNNTALGYLYPYNGYIAYVPMGPTGKLTGPQNPFTILPTVPTQINSVTHFVYFSSTNCTGTAYLEAANVAGFGCTGAGSCTNGIITSAGGTYSASITRNSFRSSGGGCTVNQNGTISGYTTRPFTLGNYPATICTEEQTTVPSYQCYVAP